LVFALTALDEYPDLSSAASALVRERHRFTPDESVRAFHDREHAEFIATRDLAATRWAGWRAHV
jgi:erythritol kinase